MWKTCAFNYIIWTYSIIWLLVQFILYLSNQNILICITQLHGPTCNYCWTTWTRFYNSYQLQGTILCLLFHTMTMKCTIIIMGTWNSVHKIIVYKYIFVTTLDWEISIDRNSSQTLCILYQKSSVSCILQKSVHVFFTIR